MHVGKYDVSKGLVLRDTDYVFIYYIKVNLASFETLSILQCAVVTYTLKIRLLNINTELHNRMAGTHISLGSIEKRVMRPIQCKSIMVSLHFNSHNNATAK